MKTKVKKKIGILLVEDHQIVRKGLKALIELEEDLYIIGEAGDGVKAIEFTKQHKPTIVLMDIALPKLNGLEATRAILKSNPKTKVIILSAHADDCYVERVQALGTSGYLVKQCSPNILIEAIRTVASGKQYFSPIIKNKIESSKSKELNFNLTPRKAHKLSTREAQVLQLIAEGYASKQIAFELKISIKTVGKHRQKLMDTLSIHDVAGLTRYAISEGYIENHLQKTTT